MALFKKDSTCPSTKSHGGVSYIREKIYATRKNHVHENDFAVSPVIATILLVAIVVILVAAVAVVILPMVDNIDVGKSVSVAVKLNDDGTLPVVTLIGGKDAESMTHLTVYVSGTKDPVISVENPKVGKPYLSSSGLGAVDKQTVSVVGTFDNTNNQTIYTGSFVFKGTAQVALAE